MKMRIFKCDQCGKKSVMKEEGKGFPYDKGWIYFYNLQIKISPHEHIRERDIHLCSILCMMKFAAQLVADVRDNNGNKQSKQKRR